MNEPVDRRFIDSDPLSMIDAVSSHSQETEHHMADPRENETSETLAEGTAEVAVSEPQKKDQRQRAGKAKPRRASGKKSSAKPTTKATDAPVPTISTGRKIYSKQERSQKLGQIEKSVERGESVKNAVTQAGISEQTYYQWKKAVASTAAVPDGDLKDLLALEEENERLKKLLAERLRRENAELKKKLGL